MPPPSSRRRPRDSVSTSLTPRARREVTGGAWLPESIDLTADPATGVARDEALEQAVRMLVEKLSPTERAVFVLREAFDYSYREIADILELSETNARQLAVRARTRLISEHRRPVRRGEHRRLLAAFSAASRTGDLAQLEHLLAAEVAMHVPPAVAA